MEVTFLENTFAGALKDRDQNLRLIIDDENKHSCSNNFLGCRQL